MLIPAEVVRPYSQEREDQCHRRVKQCQFRIWRINLLSVVSRNPCDPSPLRKSRDGLLPYWIGAYSIKSTRYISRVDSSWPSTTSHRCM